MMTRKKLRHYYKCLTNGVNGNGGKTGMMVSTMINEENIENFLSILNITFHQNLHGFWDLRFRRECMNTFNKKESYRIFHRMSTSHPNYIGLL